MHRLLLKTSTALVGICLLSAMAKNASAQTPSFGFKVSGSSVHFRYNDLPEEWSVDSRLSYGLTAFSEILLRRPVSLQLGVRWVRLGSRVDVDQASPHLRPDDRTSSIETSQSYLSLPLEIRINAFDNRVFLMAGPELGFLVAAQAALRSSQSAEERDTIQIRDDLDRLNLTAAVGGGMRFNLSGRVFLVDVRYGIGLSGVAKENWRSDWRTMERSVGIGVLL